MSKLPSCFDYFLCIFRQSGVNLRYARRKCGVRNNYHNSWEVYSESAYFWAGEWTQVIDASTHGYLTILCLDDPHQIFWKIEPTTYPVLIRILIYYQGPINNLFNFSTKFALFFMKLTLLMAKLALFLVKLGSFFSKRGCILQQR